ncbi:MAG TPA: LacI family DNA-binding transcriptional regulator [Micromonospora sp.]
MRHGGEPLAARSRPTLKDVARVAGVSITAVSEVLNMRATADRFPASTRQRIEQAARDLGYQPNEMARALRRRTSRSIGFLSAGAITTPYAVDILAAAQQVASENGHLLVVVDVGYPVSAVALEQAMDSLLQHQVSSLVVACNYHQYVEPSASLPSSTVFVNGRASSDGYRSIVPDERRAAYNAVTELLSHGHRRIAFLDDNTGTIASRLRHDGYLAALADHGVTHDPRLHVLADSMTRGGVRGEELLDLPASERPTGLFCFNDHMAMGLYRAARRRGLRIPGDLSVVGFDDQEYIASELDPPLTTMRLPHAEMGRLAIEAVLDLDTTYADWQSEVQEGGSVALVDCPIVRRDSVAGPPGLRA